MNNLLSSTIIEGEMIDERLLEEVISEMLVMYESPTMDLDRQILFREMIRLTLQTYEIKKQYGTIRDCPHCQ